MKCSQCGKEFNDDKFRAYTIDGEVHHSRICIMCEKFNDLVADAYDADTKTDRDQHIIDEAIKVYIYQLRSGLRPRGKLAYLVKRTMADKDFFDEYVKANTPKEDNTNEKV